MSHLISVACCQLAQPPTPLQRHSKCPEERQQLQVQVGLSCRLPSRIQGLSWCGLQVCCGALGLPLLTAHSGSSDRMAKP